jgi:uncharacterized membrane protein YheB (UPF0754 family)
MPDAAAPTLATWIVVPLLGGLIGYVTNWLAVKMIFRPIRPVRVLGVRVQGLLGKRQQDLARSIGRVVGGHLVQHEDIVQAMRGLDLERLLHDVVEPALASRVDQLRALPLIGGFLTAERVASLRQSLLSGILEHRAAIEQRVEAAIESGLDVAGLVTTKVAAFPVEKLEALVLEVARRELRAIEVLGGVLGVLIGLGQVLVLRFL